MSVFIELCRFINSLINYYSPSTVDSLLSSTSCISSLLLTFLIAKSSPISFSQQNIGLSFPHLTSTSVFLIFYGHHFLSIHSICRYNLHITSFCPHPSTRLWLISKWPCNHKQVCCFLLQHDHVHTLKHSSYIHQHCLFLHSRTHCITFLSTLYL